MKTCQVAKRLFVCVVAMASALLSLSSCGGDSSKIDPEFARYISAFTYGVVSPDSEIRIELAQEMPAVEINSEIEESLFDFSPSVKGRAYWINSNSIKFVPESGELKQGKRYSVKFNLGKLLNVESRFKKFRFSIKVREQSFAVTTESYMPITYSDLRWNRVEGHISLSNATPLEVVERMFSVRGGKGEAAVRLTQSEKGGYDFIIDSLERADDQKRYLLSVSGAPLGISKSEEFEVVIPPFTKDRFSLYDAKLTDGKDPHIRVIFTDPISQNQDITGLISCYGFESYTYQIDKNVIKIYPNAISGDISLQIDKGIRNSGELPLDKQYSYTFSHNAKNPNIKFLSSGNILPDTKQLLLPFSAVNLWAVDLNVIKIPKSNALYYLQSSSFNSYGYQGELRRFGRPFLKKRVRLDEDQSLDLSKENRFSLDLSDLLKKDPGAIYIVQLKMRKEYSLYPGGSLKSAPEETSMTRFEDEIYSDSEMDKWDETEAYYYDEIDWDIFTYSDSEDPTTYSYYADRDKIAKTIVMSSGIGIMAKSAHADKVTVVTTDIMSTEPLSGVKISIYNYQMQLIGQGSSSGDGFAEVRCKGGAPFILTAVKGDDFGYLKLDEGSSLSLSRFDVEGRTVERGLKGYVYGERGVWRPGDTLYLTVVLQDRENKLPQGHPVVMEVYTPLGQLYKRVVKTEGQNGFYTFAIATNHNDKTGLWNAYIKVGASKFHKSLRIETVKPNRIKINLETDSIVNASNGLLTASLKSQWLHGSPAANLKYEVSLKLSRADSPFRKYSGYIFSDPLSKFSSEEYSIAKGSLNSSGVAGINSKISMGANAPGVLRGTLLSKVYEPGGDMSFYSQQILYSPYSSYIGIKPPQSKNSHYLETDTPLNFSLVRLNANGERANSSGSLSYRVYKLSWSWWWSKAEEDLSSYVNSTGAKPIESGNIELNKGEGKLSFQIKYPEWGRYLVLVKDSLSGHATGSVIYVDWSSSRGRSDKSDPSGLTMLSFSSDKQYYEVGESATVIIPKSSKGHALITLENSSGIISKEWISTSAKEDTKYTFAITKEMTPNVYIYALLLQPYEQEDNDLPIRMYGIVNVDVGNKDSKLYPEITMPNELRPEREFKLSVSEKNRKPMTYTLAIVDEGLLDITAFKTPNAWSEFYAKEALSTRTWDMFDRILGRTSGYFGPLLAVGGDESLAPIETPVNRFKPVVKFIGPFTIKGGESKQHTLKLPPYVGSVRVMVVAGGHGAYGSAEKSVAVKNSLMTLSTLPRVLAPGEEVYLPVNLFVMNDKIKRVELSVTSKGILQPIGGNSKSVVFTKQGDKTEYFRFRVDRRLGAEEIVIKASANGESSQEIINIEIRNPNPFILLKDSKLIERGASAKLQISSDDLKQGDMALLELSRIPSVNLGGNLEYLLEYPHGCSEQITSLGFPLLYIDKFKKMSEKEKAKYGDKIAQVIKILASRQLADGGFEYWSGDNYVTEWVTTYVGHFMTEASRQGYDVPRSLLTKWASFQSKLAKSWAGSSEYRDYHSYSMVDLQQAYRLYSLALYGSPEIGAMNRLRERENLSLQARWRLAAAYALSGKKDIARELIFNAKERIDSYSSNNDSYGNSERDRAMIMETYTLLGDMERALLAAEDVSNSLNSSYITTQTASFGLYAMAKLAEKMGEGEISVDWSLNGEKREPVKTDAPLVQIEFTPSKTVAMEVKNRSKTGKVYARIVARTQPMEDRSMPIEGRLSLDVKYTDKQGKSKNISSLKQGEEFIALVTVQNSFTESFSDLVLSQVFPSGWEILNERLMSQEEESGYADYNYRDIRDDRVYSYFNIGTGSSKRFKISLQAAYRGRFFMPALSCEAMYDPKEQTRTKGQWVTVE